MSQNRAMISSHNGFSNNNEDKEGTVSKANSRLMEMPNSSALNESVLSGHRDQGAAAEGPGQPSYTPVRRNPGQAYQRTKP